MIPPTTPNRYCPCGQRRAPFCDGCDCHPDSCDCHPDHPVLLARLRARHPSMAIPDEPGNRHPSVAVALEDL